MCPAGVIPAQIPESHYFTEVVPEGLQLNSKGAPALTAPPQSRFTPNFTEPLWCTKILPPPSRIRLGNKINSPLAPQGRKQGKIDSSGHKTRPPNRFRNGRLPLDQPRHYIVTFLDELVSACQIKRIGSLSFIFLPSKHKIISNLGLSSLFLFPLILKS